MTPDVASPAEKRRSPLAQLLTPPIARLGWQLVVLSLFINVLSLGAPVFSIQVFDRVVPHSGVETLKALVIVMAAVVAFDLILRQARGEMVQRIALQIDVALSRAIYDRLARMPLARLEARRDAEWRSILRDGETIRDSLAGPTALLAIDLPFIVLFIAMISLVAAPVAWVLAALIPVYLALALVSSLSVRRAIRSEQRAAEDNYALIGEIVAGRGTAKALGLGPALRERWETAQAGMMRRAVVRGGRVDYYTHIGATLGVAAGVLMTTVGAVAIIHQEMTLGGLIAANMLASRVVQPMTQIISLWRGVERFAEAARRVNEVLSEPVDREETAVRPPRPEGVLTLEKVRFRYAPEDRPVLEALSARFAPGGLTGILGANGAGKTTVLKLLQGLYRPEEGRVLIDGADIMQFGRRELAEWIGFVPQEPFLFAGTIRDNIARCRSDVSDADILAAADRAGVRDIVDALPDGYDTLVGDGGRRFSPGVRQRIAVARALVDNPPVLLLDEPTANLDFEAERALCEELTRLKADRTVLLVSHSRPVLEICDTLIVLHEGRIVMSGRGEDVMPHQARVSGAEPDVSEEKRAS